MEVLDREKNSNQQQEVNDEAKPNHTDYPEDDGIAESVSPWIESSADAVPLFPMTAVVVDKYVRLREKILNSVKCEDVTNNATNEKDMGVVLMMDMVTEIPIPPASTDCPVCLGGFTQEDIDAHQVMKLKCRNCIIHTDCLIGYLLAQLEDQSNFQVGKYGVYCPSRDPTNVHHVVNILP
jgi:hypothetical protein